MRIIDKDDKWLDAIRDISKNQIVPFYKDSNGEINAEKTLQSFIDRMIAASQINEKYIENTNLILNLCGCIYKKTECLHLCKHHGPCHV
jgi:hypothetical protein